MRCVRTNTTLTFQRRLTDGKRVRLRPVTPADRQRLIDGVAAMSPRSRYLRFFSGLRTLREDQIRYLTEVDQAAHVAWGAVDPEQPGQPGMGLGRFVRLRDEPTVAETAVAVIDAYQHLGLGSMLLALLVAEAERRGIETLRMHVLYENQPALRWAKRLGARATHDAEGIALDLTVARFGQIAGADATSRHDPVVGAFAMQVSAFRLSLRWAVGVGRRG